METDNKDDPKTSGASSDTEIVNFSPYPILCYFGTAEGKPPLEGQIQRLEDFGFVFRSVGHFYRVGHDYICDFVLPINKEKIHATVKVVKTTESAEAYTPGGSKEKVMTVEVHFKNIIGEHRQPIRTFIREIGQKPPQAPPKQPPPQAK